VTAAGAAAVPVVPHAQLRWALLFGNFVTGCGIMVVPGTLNVRLARPLERGTEWKYLPAADVGPDWEARTGQAGDALAQLYGIHGSTSSCTPGPSLPRVTGK
jgi:hypothetical protein